VGSNPTLSAIDVHERRRRTLSSDDLEELIRDDPAVSPA